MSPEDVAAIEEATIAAVAPQALERQPGWLLPFDTGSIGRARSAVPLAHGAPAAGSAGRILAAYAARSLPAAFRLAALPAFAALEAELAALGFAARQPTQVQVADAARVAGAAPAGRVRRSTAADADWASLFLGEGFDPVDGASRVASLRRGRNPCFATLLENGRPVAAGALASQGGWAGIHGMRTALAERGRGLAGEVVAALAQEALARGCSRLFLQVEVDNAAANALYRRLGFTPAWDYAYWRLAA